MPDEPGEALSRLQTVMRAPSAEPPVNTVGVLAQGAVTGGDLPSVPDSIAALVAPKAKTLAPPPGSARPEISRCQRTVMGHR